MKVTKVAKNEQLKEIIQKTKIDDSWMWESEALLRKLSLQMSNDCSSVLDFGKSSRENYQLFNRGQIITADINQFEGYPDFLIDICDLQTFPERKFDGIICHSILEHTYEPFMAVNNCLQQLNENGVFLGFAPFLMQYHAPKDLIFQDYFRFTKDGLAYLFRNFRSVTLYPVRGRASSTLSLVKPVKNFKSKKGLEILSKLLDKAFSKNNIQCTGYVIHAIK